MSQADDLESLTRELFRVAADVGHRAGQELGLGYPLDRRQVLVTLRPEARRAVVADYLRAVLGQS